MPPPKGSHLKPGQTPHRKKFVVKSLKGGGGKLNLGAMNRGRTTTILRSSIIRRAAGAVGRFFGRGRKR